MNTAMALSRGWKAGWRCGRACRGATRGGGRHRDPPSVAALTSQAPPAERARLVALARRTYARECAAHVDRTITGILDGGALIQTHKAAILAALSIADELLRARRETGEEGRKDEGGDPSSPIRGASPNRGGVE